MIETVLDENGWPIVVGARVYAPRRPTPLAPECWNPETREGGVASVHGVVAKVEAEAVELIEFGTLNTRTLRPEVLRVQRGESAQSKEYLLILEALRRRPR